jgi:putative oxidoreductase
VPLLVRIALGALFVIAGSLKIGHAADLAAAITAYRLGFPPQVVAAMAVALPPLEILLGVYLIVGLLLPLVSGVAVAVLALFTSIVASAVIRGLSAPCGCFGPADNAPATWITVLRDLTFLLPAVYLAWWSRARGRLGDPITGRETSASG